MTSVFQVLVLILLFTNISAQVPPMYNLSAVNGMPSSNIYRVCQDKKGFLWIATENGLCRYDGNEIKVFNTQNGLPDNSVIHVSQDFSDNLWICTYNEGMCLLKNDSFMITGDSLKLASQQIVKIIHTRKSVWLMNSQRILFTIQNNLQKPFCLPSGDTPVCKSIISVNDTSIVFLADDKLFIYSDETGVRFLANNPIPDAQLFFPLDKNFVVLCERDIYFLNVNFKVERAIKLDDRNVWNDLVQDSKGNIWVSSGSELIKLEQGNNIIRYKGFFSPNPIYINDLFIDKWDNIWLATYGAGLYCIWNKDITYLPATSGKIQYNVTALSTDKKNIFISSLGGSLVRWNNNISTPLHLSCSSLNDYIYFQLSLNDTLVIGKNNSLCFISRIIENQPPNCFCQPFRGGATSGLVDSKGLLWIGHFRGITIHKNNNYTWLKNEQIQERRINAICEYHPGLFYFGTDKGLYCLSGSVVSLVFLPAYPDTRFITSLLVDKNNNLWIGTRGGLYIKKAGQSFVTPFNHVFLSRTKISQLLATSDSAVWIASYEGVYRYANDKLISFNRQNGLISDHILSLSFDFLNRLWVGTPDGISIISSKRFENELEMIPELHITSVQFDNKIEKYPRQITVFTNTDNIIVNLTAILFPTSSHIKFQYRLLGLHDNWQELPTRSLVFSSLPKGNYTLEIRTLEQAAHNLNQMSLVINVMPMFYETMQFRIIVFGLVIFTMLITVNYFIQRAHRRAQRRNWRRLRTMYLRLQSVQASLNPHFIFNSLNSILALLKTQRREQAEYYLSGFSKLLRKTIETNANTFITLKDELERLKQYLELEKIRFSNSFTYKIEVSSEFDFLRTKIPVMVVQPFVENALKHGIRQNINTNGIIEIEFIKTGNGIRILVSDNGIGYYTSLKARRKVGHNSLGIQMVQRQLDLLSKSGRGKFSLSIYEKTLGQGTIVEIHLPEG